MTTGQAIARKLLDDEQWQREGLVNWGALAQWVDLAIEEARAEMAHEHLIENDRAVAAAIEAAIEAEREACAKLMDGWAEEFEKLAANWAQEPGQGIVSTQYAADAASACWLAHKIRARAQLPPVVD